MTVDSTDSTDESAGLDAAAGAGGSATEAPDAPAAPTSATLPDAPDAPDAPAAPDTPGTPTRATLPGLILALGSVLPAVLAAAWVLAALPLLVLHIYRPLPAALLGLGLAAAFARPVVRVVRAAAARYGEVPWWVLVGVLIVVVVFGALTFAHSAQDVLVRRDPGSYAMSASWLSTHGTIQMPTHAPLFGAPNPHLVLASQGFYRQGSHVIPQFMSGVPALLAIGGWFSGLSGVLHGNAVIFSFALLAFAGLAVRLIGARYAPLAVLALALLQPELDVARATYSEPAAQLIVLGGLAIVIDALAAGRLLPGRSRSADVGDPPRLPPRLAGRGVFIGGLVLGLVSVVRIDAIADLVFLVPFVGWLAFHRIAAWRRLALGLLLGMAAGGFDCVALTLPYAKHVGADLKIIGIVFGCVLIATLVVYVVAFLSRRGAAASDTADAAADTADAAAAADAADAAYRAVPEADPEAPEEPRRALSVLAALGVFMVGLFFFLRPHLMTMRSGATSGGANYVLQVQRFLHMPEDPTRSYYENATIWLSWYFGWATLALALLGACRLAFDLVAGRRQLWWPAFLVFFGLATLVLFKPSITPDHPWADRRFVPVVLPGVVLFALAAFPMILRILGARHLSRRLSGARSRRVAEVILGLALTALVVVPAWLGSREVLYDATEKGEPALVRTVCAALQPGDVVLAIGNRAKTEWPGTLRVLCNVDAAYLDGVDDANQMAAIGEQVSAQGGRLMLLAESTSDKDKAKFEAVWPDRPTAALVTSEATHTLVERPGQSIRFGTEIWLGRYQLGGA